MIPNPEASSARTPPDTSDQQVHVRQPRVPANRQPLLATVPAAAPRQPPVPSEPTPDGCCAQPATRDYLVAALASATRLPHEGPTGVPSRLGSDAAAAVRDRSRVFAAVLDVATDAVIVTEAEAMDEPGPRILYANPAFTEHTGYAVEEVIGLSPRFLQGPRTSPQAKAQIRAAMKAWQPVRVELVNYRKDGTPFWTELSIAPLADETGWFTHWVSVQRDVSERKAAQAHKNRELGLVQAVLSSLPSHTAVLDPDGTIVAVNDAWHAFWAANTVATHTEHNAQSCYDGGVGANYLQVCANARDEGAGEARACADGIRDVIAGARRSFAMEYECSSPTQRRWFHLDVVPLTAHTPDDDSRPNTDSRADGLTAGRRRSPAAPWSRQVVVSHQDISDRKHSEFALAHHTSHDPLTGLANRTLLLSRLAGLLSTARPSQDPLRDQHDTPAVALLFVDLNGFKTVNDSLGHGAGDDLLRVTAARLRAATREQDVVARLGGDEFLVCATGVGVDAATALATRVQEAVAEPMTVNGLVLEVSVSIGIAMAGPLTTPEELVRDACAALYRAKERGRGRVEVFARRLHAGGERRLRIAAGLRRALERDELVLHYQPIVDLATGRLLEREALIRWQQPATHKAAASPGANAQHSAGRLIGPDGFLDVAAEAGLLIEIGEWVLDRACSQAVLWRAAGQDVPVAVNVAPVQLAEPGLVQAVTRALASSGLPAQMLVLEVTEQGVLSNEDLARDVLTELRGLGARVALDDFGTGYSSLAHLARLPVDVLKVDRQFVSGTGLVPQAILRAVAMLGTTLGLGVVAEGIETSAQQQAALEAGCTHGQGWLFGRPTPLPGSHGP